MLICETDVIMYLAKIKWTAPSRSRTINRCERQRGLTYICSSKLFLTPSFFDNNSEISCQLTDVSGLEYSEVQRGRLEVGGTTSI